MTPDRIELKQKIHFATDRAEILPDSFDLLDEVADALRSRPKARVRIEGHTDGRGSSDHNQKLSQARADSVRGYLVARNVGGEQLVAKGFGATRKLADDRTPEGQEQNRRVEFLIVSGE